MHRPPAAPRAVRLVMRITLVLALFGAAHAASAQIIRSRRAPDPSFWISGGVGTWQSQSVNDGRSQSEWRFGSGVQWRVGLERGLGGGNTFGLLATQVRAPFRFLQAGACDRGCDASATVQSLALAFHGGGGQGLHQVIEASVGATRFSKFDIAAPALALAPPTIGRDIDTDASFAIGYGFGYQVNPRLQVALVQDFGVIWHQKDGLASDASNVVQQRVTRLSARLGGGQRRAVR